MKTILTLIAAGTLLATLATAQQPRYSVTDLGTLGGTYSYAYGVNNLGWVAGGAATPSQTNGLSQTAFLSFGFGNLIDLGTLDGQACPDCNSEGAAPNIFGEVAVISETSKTDPNGEDFCGFSTHRQCLAAIWQNWRLTALPTLAGGNNAQTYWMNNRGQVVGVAENGTFDSTCATATPYQQLQFEAVKWGPNGEIQELLPLPLNSGGSPPDGDTVAFGFGINDNGQAVGVSGLCSNTSARPVSPFSGAPHAVLWESNGSAINLGTLGGEPAFNVPSAINDRGEVGGASRSSSDGTIHPFLWTKQTGMQDLGTFPGAMVTAITCCNTLNNHGEAVGVTADSSGNTRAFLWHDNALTDLNTLIPADSPLYLTSGSSINDSGRIVGTAIVKSSCPTTTPPTWQGNQGACTEVHAFLATPCGHNSGAEGCMGDTSITPAEPRENAERPTVVLSNSARKPLLR
jgi:probable HAF family extracellular repeat protein